MLGSIISTIHSLLGGAINILLLPVAWCPAAVQLIYLSLICGVVFLLIYGLVSNQSALAKVKREITAAFYEAILFRHDIIVALKAQGVMLLKAGRYLWLAVPPLIILLIPCLFILGQLNERYGVRGLRGGEEALLTAVLQDPAKLSDLRIEADSALEISQPVRNLSSGEVVWRVRAVEGGNALQNLKISAGGELIDYQLALDGKIGVAKTGVFSSWDELLLYAGHLAPSGVVNLALNYPESSYFFLGVSWHWVLIFFLVSVVSGLLASRVFKIEV